MPDLKGSSVILELRWTLDGWRVTGKLLLPFYLHSLPWRQPCNLSRVTCASDTSGPLAIG